MMLEISQDFVKLKYSIIRGKVDSSRKLIDLKSRIVIFFDTLLCCWRPEADFSGRLFEKLKAKCLNLDCMSSFEFLFESLKISTASILFNIVVNSLEEFKIY